MDEQDMNWADSVGKVGKRLVKGRRYIAESVVKR
jgi:hypothetical protein